MPVSNAIKPSLLQVSPAILASNAIQIGPLSSPAVSSKLTAASNGLSSTPISQVGNLSTLKTEDVYSFNISGYISGKGNINLSLHDISAGDDADLFLYKDNGNGVFDAGDALVRSSVRGGNADDAINVRADAGQYFAKVSRYAPGSSGDVQYKLDLSASRPSNLLPTETAVGSLPVGRKTFTGNIGDNNTADTYSFSQGFFRKTRITLSGLTNDADVHVIRDVNNNKIYDAADAIVGSSTRGGSLSETININGRGSYMLQVYQYSGETNYTLRMNTTSTLLPFAS
jgi:hypothetical protein